MHDSVALVFGASAGTGGLGLQVASALNGLGEVFRSVHAFGPGAPPDCLAPDLRPRVLVHPPPLSPSALASRFTWLRWWTGRHQLLRDRRLGRWAAARVRQLRPEACYLFTQVALETLRWARGAGLRTILDNPNGHIRGFRDVYCRESARLCGRSYRGHPHEAMVRRVEEEYRLADDIRVSSVWAKESLVQGGVPEGKITVVPQPVDLNRYCPVPRLPASDGPLRVCYVGSLDLRKGFVYLLRAARASGQRRTRLRFVGATGDRCCRRLLERESSGLMLEVAPGDPLPAYSWAEVFVLPSLEDGFGFVVAEAMACGLPVIVTDCCGAAGLVRHAENGWIIKAGSVDALRDALEEAARRRSELAAMGLRARADIERFAAQSEAGAFARSLFPEAAAATA